MDPLALTAPWSYHILYVEAARPRVGFRDLEFNHVNIKFQM